MTVETLAVEVEDKLKDHHLLLLMTLEINDFPVNPFVVVVYT